MSDCVYLTYRDDGHFYIGRAAVKKVLDGSYTGSGIFYREFRRLNSTGWATILLADGLTHKQAVQVEAELISDTTLDDPLCLNLRSNRGGHAGAHDRFKVKCRDYNLVKWRETVAEVSKIFDLREPDTLEEGNALLKRVGPPWNCYVMG